MRILNTRYKNIKCKNLAKIQFSLVVISTIGRNLNTTQKLRRKISP